MTLGDMRDLGVQRLIASCLNPACRHTALIEAWSYPGRDRNSVLQEPCCLRKVRSARKQDRCAAQLERANDASEPDWEGVALMGARGLFIPREQSFPRWDLKVQYQDSRDNDNEDHHHHTSAKTQSVDERAQAVHP
jgi:hypothetical protein